MINEKGTWKEWYVIGKSILSSTLVELLPVVLSGSSNSDTWNQIPVPPEFTVVPQANTISMVVK